MAGDAVSAVASVAQGNANACARSIWTFAFQLLIKTVCQSSRTSTKMCIFMNSLAVILKSGGHLKIFSGLYDCETLKNYGIISSMMNDIEIDKNVFLVGYLCPCRTPLHWRPS